MNFSDQLKHKSVDEQEELFVAALSEQPVAFPPLLEAVEFAASQNDTQRADSWADLLQSELAKLSDKEGIIAVMAARCRWRGRDPVFRQECSNALRSAFNDRLGKQFIISVGLEENVTLPECLRRLKTLVGLAPGVFCLDKTWGFGIVGRVDDFYRKVTIDFEKKPGHDMTFAYAAETLRVLQKDHLLSVRHLDPARIRDIAENNPAELVRLALKSYGPMDSVQLKNCLVETVMPESDWHDFWARARTALKKDPLVDVPAKKDQPLRILDKPMEPDEALLIELQNERAPEKILALLGKVIALAPKLRSDRIQEAATEKFALAVHAIPAKRPDLSARALLVGQRMSLQAAGRAPDLAPLAQGLLSEKRLAAALCGIPVREVPALLTSLHDFDAEQTVQTTLRTLAQLEAAPLGAAADFLIRVGRRADCVEATRDALGSITPSPTLVLWLCRNPEHDIVAELAPPSRILRLALDSLEQAYTGSRMKAQKAVRALLEDADWMGKTLAASELPEREEFFKRVARARAMDDVSRRSMLALMIRLYPDLEAVLTRAEQPAAPGPAMPRLTSRRKHRARQRQLRDLVQVHIPRNSRDIAAARSYGDLRENFEYQTARDQQKLLLRRKEELERDLKEVGATDFRDCPSDVAGVGASVVIARNDGTRQKFVILGEWDTDEKMGIVSSQSGVAAALCGHRPGDEVALPAHNGQELCTIEEVAPLNDEVRAWIEADDDGTAQTNPPDSTGEQP